RKWEPGDREYPTLKEYKRRRARSDAERAVRANYNLGLLIRDVLGKATEAHRKAPVAFAGLTGFNRPDIQIPTRTGVMYLLDYLSRPGVATQTALGKALVKAGAI